MDDYPSEEEIAWFQGVGIKKIYLDSAFKYYPELGKILRESKQILLKTAKAVSTDVKEREIFFSYLFSASIQTMITSSLALEEICTALLNLHKTLGVYMYSLLVLLSSKKGILQTSKDLETIGNLATAMGKTMSDPESKINDAVYVLSKGLPEVGDKLHSINDVVKACQYFLNVIRISGANTQHVFGLLHQVRPLINDLNDIVPVGYGLVEAWKAWDAGELRLSKGDSVAAFVTKFLASKKEKISAGTMKRVA